jgi:hypothetical protein
MVLDVESVYNPATAIISSEGSVDIADAMIVEYERPPIGIKAVHFS